VATKELIKAEIDKVEDEHLEELYGVVRRLSGGARKQTEKGEGPSAFYIGSPRLVRRSQAVDFVKEVVDDT
jgi:hypothetical protein